MVAAAIGPAGLFVPACGGAASPWGSGRIGARRVAMSNRRRLSRPDLTAAGQPSPRESKERSGLGEASSGRTGRVGIFSEDRDDVSFPDTMMRLTLVSDVAPAFAGAVISSSHGRAHMRRTAAGSATSMVKINRASLGRLEFPAISVAEQERFLTRLANFDRAISETDMQHGCLSLDPPMVISWVGLGVI